MEQIPRLDYSVPPAGQEQEQPRGFHFPQPQDTRPRPSMGPNQQSHESLSDGNEDPSQFTDSQLATIPLLPLPTPPHPAQAPAGPPPAKRQKTQESIVSLPKTHPLAKEIAPLPVPKPTYAKSPARIKPKSANKGPVGQFP